MVHAQGRQECELISTRRGHWQVGSVHQMLLLLLLLLLLLVWMGSLGVVLG